jgi:hypothetical protein
MFAGEPVPGKQNNRINGRQKPVVFYEASFSLHEETNSKNIWQWNIENPRFIH